MMRSTPPPLASNDLLGAFLVINNSSELQMHELPSFGRFPIYVGVSKVSSIAWHHVSRRFDCKSSRNDGDVVENSHLNIISAGDAGRATNFTHEVAPRCAFAVHPDECKVLRNDSVDQRSRTRTRITEVGSPHTMSGF